MTGSSARELVERDTQKRLFRLYNLPEHPQKAALANLRRGVGRVPGDLPELWGEFLLPTCVRFFVFGHPACAGAAHWLSRPV